MEQVDRWWNGNFGRLARRDIWLRTDGQRWQVEVREGGADDGRSVTLDFDAEPAAREQVATLLDERYGRWRQL